MSFNCRDYLKALCDKEIVDIASQLRISVFVKGVNRLLILRITEVLTNWDSLYRYAISCINRNEKDRLCLRQLVYTGETQLDTTVLRRYGIAYNCKIPSDILSVLKLNLRTDVIHDLDLKNEFLPSANLKFILFVKYLWVSHKPIVKDTLIKKITNTYGFIDKKNGNVFIDYLIGLGFIKLDKKKTIQLSGNIIDLLSSNNNQYIDLYKFYNFIFSEYGITDIWVVLNKISSMQEREEEWIILDIYNFSQLILEKGMYLGLFVVTSKDNGKYIRLTPEGWFLCKQLKPQNWERRTVVFSADFEVFMPFDYDPSVISEVLKNCNNTEVEYLLVHKIPQGKDFQPSQSFVDLALSKSLFLPDVVRYEFLRHSKKMQSLDNEVLYR